MTEPLRVALGEYDTGWHDPAGSIARAERLIAGAARAGARLVVLPEMAASGFTMEVERAEPIAGESATRLAAAARAHGVWVLAGLALRDGADARAVNAAVLWDPAGEIHASYHKQKLFAFAEEHRHYEPGAAPAVVEIEGVRCALFICYDLRFPELFRAVAREVDAMLLVANWPMTRRLHWDTLVRARAIENQCAFVAVNRVGEGGGLKYDGGSAAYDAWGEPLATVGEGGGVRIVAIDPEAVAKVRAKFPFLRDLGSEITV